VDQEWTPESAGSDSAAVARRVEKLALAGFLSSRLAGEMRQSLSVMRAAVYFLNSHFGTELDDKARRHLSFLLQEVEEMGGIASNLGSLVGNEISDRQVVHVDVLVSAALDRVQSRPGVTIETALDPDAVLFGDPTQIQLALTNIVNNSLQAVHGEGRIRIVCQNVVRETRVVISDNGVGMPEGVRGRVFEPFFTTSPHRVGIGLTVAQRMVGACGGTIAIESTPGVGTTVTLSFPRYEDLRRQGKPRSDE
jgi:signal transduction histidine kinase